MKYTTLVKYGNGGGSSNSYIDSSYGTNSSANNSNKNLNVNSAYEYLKTLEEFKDAEDVFEESDDEVEITESETTEPETTNEE